MCGIQAILSPDINLLIPSGGVEKRGPDSSTTIANSSGFFRFFRLAINDLTVLGNQPMHGWDDQGQKIMLMCNGEIYNHSSLRKDHGLECESNSDCEVIIRLYEKFIRSGDKNAFVNMIKLLDGIFAIVLVHGNITFYTRDRIGVKPLYIGTTKKDGYPALSSLVAGLLPFAENIRQVPPGIVFKYNKSSRETSLEHVFRFVYSPGEEKLCYEKIRMLMFNAVKKRLGCERKIGCLLSGGVDSSIIASILVHFLGGQNVRTYSIGFKDSVDLKYARIVAKHLNTVHTEVIMDDSDNFSNIIGKVETIIKNLETYDITTIRASMGMYSICEYISKNTDDVVIFSGEGADELFGGYLYFHNAPSAEDANLETLKLLYNLHEYDVLRADRCISSNGLELREPFLDKEVVDYVLKLASVYKTPSVNEQGVRIEKYILRKAFEDYLPFEIVWRRKDGFSDGVSGFAQPWFRYISDEKNYYRKIFDELFNGYNLSIQMWMPKWSNQTDPSGRALTIYDEKNKNEN